MDYYLDLLHASVMPYFCFEFSWEQEAQESRFSIKTIGSHGIPILSVFVVCIMTHNSTISHVFSFGKRETAFKPVLQQISLFWCKKRLICGCYDAQHHFSTRFATMLPVPPWCEQFWPFLSRAIPHNGAWKCSSESTSLSLSLVARFKGHRGD